MTTLSLDFETYSAVDIRKAGLYRYAADPSTGIWCMAYAFDDEEPRLWVPGKYHASDCSGRGRGCDCPGVPSDILGHLDAGGAVRAWNAQFERTLWNTVMRRQKPQLPRIDIEQTYCTAAEAAAMNLPRSLGQCALATGVQEQKDDSGYREMLRLARPRLTRPDGSHVWWSPEEHPSRFARLHQYCMQDVRTEHALARVLRRLTKREQEMYWLDQKINDRGVRLDIPYAQGLQQIAGIANDLAAEDLARVTGGFVTKPTQVARIRQFVQAQGVEVDSLDKTALAELMQRELPESVSAALLIRADAAKASAAKLTAMFACVNSDERMRGLLLYHAAGTGRWGGKLVQPQNFPRGEVEAGPFFEYISRGDHDAVSCFANPLTLVSSALRGCLIPSAGAQLVAGDYSAIEARVLAWLAGEGELLAQFRRYDEGDKTQDPYVRAAMRLYKLPFEAVQKFPHRQTGKFQILGCGFQMGKKRARDAAKLVYQLTISEEEAEEIVESYRAANTQIVQFWWDLDDAAKEAVREPGSVQTVGVVKFTKRGSYLYCILPSGRPLCYAAPRLEMRRMPEDWDRVEVFEGPGGRKQELRTPQYREGVVVSGVNSQTKKWVREHYYGGKWAENITQAVARDLMAEGMRRAEEAGFRVLLSVHDEVVAEHESLDHELLERVLEQVPAWALGCPVKAEGWTGDRYRK